MTRRQFLTVAATAAAGFLLACSTRRYGRRTFLSDDEARTLAAICDQIVPGDDFPSASRAGVLDYIDRQLNAHYRRHRQAYAEGLQQADRLCINRFGVHLSEASPAQQFAVVSMTEQQNPSFFNLVRNHTFEGYYGPPRHGGNRDAVSWQMLGLPTPPLRGRAQYDFTRTSRS